MGINAPRAPRRERCQFCLGTWKQPKCPLTEEWIKKMWYIYNDGISVIKRNETGSLSDMEGPGVCHTE